MNVFYVRLRGGGWEKVTLDTAVVIKDTYAGRLFKGIVGVFSQWGCIRN